MQEKQRCMILFFQFFNHFVCRFASRYCQKCLLWEKHCNCPLTTTQSDRFASYENIVSRSHTSSLPSSPPASPPGTHECILYELFRYLEKAKVLKISFKCKLCLILGVPEDWPFQLSVWMSMLVLPWLTLRTQKAAFFTWLASMQIYWNKRKGLHKKRVQLP